MKATRITALLLTFCLLLTLAACGGTDPGTPETSGATQPSSGNTGSPGNAVTPVNAEPEMVYQATFTALPKDIEYLGSATVVDGRVWALGSTYDEETMINESFLASFLPDGSDFRKIPLLWRESASYQTFTVASNGSIYLIEAFYEETGRGGDGKTGYVQQRNTFFLIKLSAEGEELARTELTLESEDEWVWVSSIREDRDGNLFLGISSGIQVVNPEGETLFALKCDNYSEGIALSADGDFLSFGWGMGSYEVRTVDTAAKAWGKTHKLPRTNGSVRLSDGDGEYLFYAVCNNAFCGYDVATQEFVPIINLLTLDIDPDRIELMTQAGKEEFFCVSRNENWQSELCTIKKAPKTRDQTVLTYGCLYLDYTVKAKIIAFNKHNPDYRIEVVDYSIYNTESDVMGNAGQMRMNADIIGGKMPDILATGNGLLPLDAYIAKGLLLDLNTFLVSDPDLHPDMLLQSALEALSQDGKLYQLSPTFTILTMYGLRSRIGDRAGWTLPELAEFIRANNAAMPFAYTDAENVLRFLIMLTGRDFIDYATGKCDFTSDAFLSLLEIAARAPAEVDYNDYRDPDEMMLEGSALLNMYGLSQVTDLQRILMTLNNDLALVGFPSADGAGHVASFTTGAAVSAKSAHPDGAWAFIKSLFETDESAASYMRYGYGIPLLKTAYEEVLTEAATPSTYTDDDGNVIEQPKLSMMMSSPDGGGQMYEIYAAKPEEIALFRQLVDSTKHTFHYDETLLEIILEETGAYFAGQKSARDVATIIQSRAQIYLAESR